jgi:hypothetical protein
MKVRTKAGFAIIAMLTLVAFTGCSAPQVKALNPGDYADPAEEERAEALPVYIAWDSMGGETWEYTFSVDGVIEEGNEPASPDPYVDEDGMTVIEEIDAPGGRSVWFYGVSPGDVVVTFTTEDSQGKVVDIQQYAIRVYDNLQLALLHYQYDDFRD